MAATRHLDVFFIYFNNIIYFIPFLANKAQERNQEDPIPSIATTHGIQPCRLQVNSLQRKQLSITGKT
ncbi:hypothetical protein AQUSIP_14640 [Aquicella siphonis]|uniref:Uncharacterized protein n=1 Tax=Aquicella siphonis TaxID=254247 RepID=A0A5E4PGQ5_9COXI|nr:hypothetical protein AQUSIP_14640 [Aquicella siphonis]